jgi:hypothetical protein
MIKYIIYILTIYIISLMFMYKEKYNIINSEIKKYNSDKVLLKETNIINNLYDYSKLKEKIIILKKKNKPLLIKINSHPCSGKTRFIYKNNKTYKTYKLVDFDNIKVRYSKFLLNKNKVILFGSHHQEEKLYDEIIYIFVIPEMKQLKKNILSRQKFKFKFMYNKYDKTYNIINDSNQGRKAVINNIIQNKECLFHSFSTAIDFCIDTYNNN